MVLLFFIHFHFCLRLPPPFFKREPGTQGCLASAFRKSPLLKKRGFMCFIVRYRLFLSDASRFISGTVCRRTSATISSSALHTRRSWTFFASLKVLARVYKRPANNPAQANIRCLATIFVFMHKCQFIRYLAYNIPEARKCKPEVCKKNAVSIVILNARFFEIPVHLPFRKTDTCIFLLLVYCMLNSV